jgi:hypothetical protein
MNRQRLLDDKYQEHLDNLFDEIKNSEKIEFSYFFGHLDKLEFQENRVKHIVIFTDFDLNAKNKVDEKLASLRRRNITVSIIDFSVSENQKSPNIFNVQSELESSATKGSVDLLALNIFEDVFYPSPNTSHKFADTRPMFFSVYYGNNLIRIFEKKVSRDN